MPKNLLVADDSVVIQKSIGITFAQEDFTITYTGNGEDALVKARQLKPDVILADVVMPKKNGYELCELVKKDPQLRSIPVLLLAGTHEPFDEARGKAVGAVGHIIKPFESKALLDRVTQLVVGRERGMVPEPSPPPKPATIPPPVPSPFFSTERVAEQAPIERAAPMLELEVPEPGPTPAPVSEPVFDFSLEGGETVASTTVPPPIDVTIAEEAPLSEVPPTERFWDFSGEPAQEEPKEAAVPPASEGQPSWGEFFKEPWEVPGPEPAGAPSEGGPASPTDEFGFDLMSEKAAPPPGPEISVQAAAAPPPEPETTTPRAAPAVESTMGVALSEAQIEAIVTKVFQNVIERIAWEVVPELAETIIKEELARLTQEPS